MVCSCYFGKRTLLFDFSSTDAFLSINHAITRLAYTYRDS